MKSARVIITTRCNLCCEYCCNKLAQVQREFTMTTLEQLAALRYDNYVITGGEPLLEPEKLRWVLESLALLDAKLYLCTNGTITPSETDMDYYAGWLDGVNVGYHGNMLAVRNTVYWRRHIFNTRLDVEDEKLTDKIKLYAEQKMVEIHVWHRDDCETDEDKYII